MNNKKLNCICWIKDYNGKSFNIAGVTIYERKHKPLYEEELSKGLEAPTFEGVIRNIKNKMEELGGSPEEFICLQALPDGEHFYMLYHWNERTHEYYTLPKNISE